MAHRTFKQYLKNASEHANPATDLRVRRIQREMHTNKHLSEGDRLILEMLLIQYEWLAGR